MLEFMALKKWQKSSTWRKFPTTGWNTAPDAAIASAPSGTRILARAVIPAPGAHPGSSSSQRVGQPQRLADRPRLERAAAGRVRWLGVGDLGDVPDAGVVEVGEERRQEALAGRAPRGL